MSMRALIVMLLVLPQVLIAAEPSKDPPADRRQRAQLFHLRAQERTGILVPLYVYPGEVSKNPHFTRLIELRRRFETVPMWVIVNPASGPGKQVDPNYTAAIDRLVGAGCVCIGYVSTDYAKRGEPVVREELKRWREFYPRVQGIFFDEMVYEDKPEAVAKQVALNRAARDAGFWPTVGNPGTDTPGRYFVEDAADVIVVHEADSWPTEAKLKGEIPGGYADHPAFTRGLLLHSQKDLDAAKLRMARKYVRWVYITDDPYRPGDPKAPNPWDTVSTHLEKLCEELAK
jgi:hypothetical protein